MPKEEVESSGTDVDWSKSIRSLLKSSDVRDVKKLRKMVLLSLQMEESDKASKKTFKRTIQQLEEEGVLSLEADGSIKMTEKKRKRDKAEKKSKKKKKQKKESEDADEDEDESKQTSWEDTPEADSQDAALEGSGGGDKSKSKNTPCKGNPQGITRLFLGNLPFTVDESSLGAFLPGEVTHIKWITDKETGKFYGSAFIEMNNSISASEAVAMTGQKLIGRPLKVNLAPAREGDVWPPVKKVVSGGGQAGGSGVKAMSAKPDDCFKLFIGNLSYDIDDEGIKKFFESVDAEVKAVRWLHHKESGDFKGWYVFCACRNDLFARLTLTWVILSSTVDMLSFGKQKNARKPQHLMERVFLADLFASIGLIKDSLDLHKQPI
jgi:nucleolin